MNKLGIVAAAGLAAGVVWFACWRLAGSSSTPAPTELRAEALTKSVGGSDAPDSPVVGEAGPPTAEEFWIEKISSEPRVGTRRTRRPEEVPPGEGTVILVVDSRDEEPIERFALRIWKGATVRDTDSESIEDVPVEEFSEGALLVEIPLEGFRFAIGAPGYLPVSGEITPVSSTDRRAFIRLDREARVRGRVVFEGQSVSGVRVRLRAGRRVAQANGEDLGAWYDDPPAPTRVVTKRAWTDEEGFFEIGGLPAGDAELSIWNNQRLDLERELGVLELGEELDLGDLELVRKPEPDEAVVELRWRDEWTRPRSDGSTRVIKGSEASSIDYIRRQLKGAVVRSRGPDATVRVQAFDGERPIVGATVIALPLGRPAGKEVGVTDEAGEVIFALNPAEPAHLILRIGSRLPLGRTETPVTAVLGRETFVPIVLHCGALVIEIPEGFQPGRESALLVQFESETFPYPGTIMVTLRGDPADFADEGIRWKGNRCELPSLGAGYYRISVDVMKRAGERSRTLLPTELRYEGEVEVVAGGKVTCVLAER